MSFSERHGEDTCSVGLDDRCKQTTYESISMFLKLEAENVPESISMYAPVFIMLQVKPSSAGDEG